jgi:hypothetical protein
MRESYVNLFACCVHDKCLPIWKGHRACPGEFSRRNHFRQMIGDIQQTHQVVRSKGIVNDSEAVAMSSPHSNLHNQNEFEAVISDEDENDNTPVTSKRKDIPVRFFLPFSYLMF